jgi:hypothetical protein
MELSTAFRRNRGILGLFWGPISASSATLVHLSIFFRSTVWPTGVSCGTEWDPEARLWDL